MLSLCASHAPSFLSQLLIVRCDFYSTLFTFTCSFLLPCSSCPAPAAWKSKHPSFSGTIPGWPWVAWGAGTAEQRGHQASWAPLFFSLDFAALSCPERQWGGVDFAHAPCQRLTSQAVSLQGAEGLPLHRELALLRDVHPSGDRRQQHCPCSRGSCPHQLRPQQSDCKRPPFPLSCRQCRQRCCRILASMVGHMWDMDQGSQWQHLHSAMGSDFFPITFLYKP